MHNLIKKSGIILLSLLTLSLAACHQGEPDSPSKPDGNDNGIPDLAQFIIEHYYHGSSIRSIQTRKSDSGDGGSYYTVILDTEDELTFDEKGDWVEISAGISKVIPDGIVDDAITQAIKRDYSSTPGINRIKIEGDSFRVKLLSENNLNSPTVYFPFKELGLESDGTRRIKPDDLPADIKWEIARYTDDYHSSYSYSIKKRGGYMTYILDSRPYTDNIRVILGEKGELLKYEGNNGNTLSTWYVPSSIGKQLRDNYGNNTAITFFFRKRHQYIIRLADGAELRFDHNEDWDNPDDSSRPIKKEELPDAAFFMIDRYYKDKNIERITLKAMNKDNSEFIYSVSFSSNDIVTFDNDGDWIEITAPSGSDIPDGIIYDDIVRIAKDEQPHMNGISCIGNNGSHYHVTVHNSNGLNIATVRISFNQLGISSDGYRNIDYGDLPDMIRTELNKYPGRLYRCCFRKSCGYTIYCFVIGNNEAVILGENGELLEYDGRGMALSNALLPKVVGDYIRENIHPNANAYWFKRSRLYYEVKLMDRTIKLDLAGKPID